MTVINAVNAWQMEKKRFQNWRTAVPYTRRLVIFEVPQDFSRFFEIFRDFTRPQGQIATRSAALLREAKMQ